MTGRTVSIRQQIVRFVMVGACGTLLQYLILWIGASWLRMPAPWASAAGYLAGSIVNYFLNYTVTFGSAVAHRSALIRYYAMVGGGWLLTLGMMALFVNALNMNKWGAQITTTLICLAFNFLLSRIWVYRSHGVG